MTAMTDVIPNRDTHDIRIAFNQRVPMRDGVTLSADVYFPAEASPANAVDAVDVDGAPTRWPIILTRTPYLKASAAVLTQGRSFADAGYVFVAMDVRGRGDSDGAFTPYLNEGRDGYDAIEWLAAQSWSNGHVGTIGGSYPGCIQWLAALEQPPHLSAMVVLVAPSDPFVETPTGLPSPMHLCWLHYVSGRVNQPMEAVDWARIYDHLPMLTMDERAGRVIPHWRDTIAHAQLDDFWEPLRYQTKFERIAVPTLHISGWYDDEQVGTPLNYIGMTTRAATPEARASQRLLMGPWGHAVNAVSKLGEVDFGPQALIDLRGEQTRWFDRWLRPDANHARTAQADAASAGQAAGASQAEATPNVSAQAAGKPSAARRGKRADAAVDAREATASATSATDDAPVRIFVMGANRWRDEREWPLARTQWTPFYLHSNGRANSRFGDGALTTDAPTADAPTDGYRYDPARPVPFITEPTSSQIGGPGDYAAIERRDDVLVYVTPPLTADLEVTGPVRVELYAASSAPDTDFMAKLVDVWPNGFTQRLCDGMVRARFRDGMASPAPIEPGQVYHYTIDCWNTAQVFRAGHRIGLEIASSAFPKYDRNPNTGAPLGQTTELAVAEQRIYHDTAHPSALILPVIPRGE